MASKVIAGPKKTVYNQIAARLNTGRWSKEHQLSVSGIKKILNDFVAKGDVQVKETINAKLGGIAFIEFKWMPKAPNRLGGAKVGPTSPNHTER